MGGGGGGPKGDGQGLQHLALWYELPILFQVVGQYLIDCLKQLWLPQAHISWQTEQTSQGVCYTLLGSCGHICL